MTLTKVHLTNSVFENCQIQKQTSIFAVEFLLEVIKHTLESGEDVLISGFGKFCVKDKRSRKGRNPQTGEGALLMGRRVVTFKTSKVLKDKINSKNR